MSQYKVLMVCLGNICRSPTAQGALEHVVAERGLEHLVKVDSAGTSNWHIGEPPDPRTVRAARSRKLDLSAQRARQVTPRDFHEFDYVLAMDSENLAHLQRLAPPDYQGHLSLFLDFAPGARGQSVPDPYHGGPEGFEVVLDLCQAAAEGLLDAILARANTR